ARKSALLFQVVHQRSADTSPELSNFSRLRDEFHRPRVQCAKSQAAIWRPCGPRLPRVRTANNLFDAHEFSFKRMAHHSLSSVGPCRDGGKAHPGSFGVGTSRDAPGGVEDRELPFV